MIVFHGTNKKFDVIDLSKSKDKRDFGKGFYTTTIFEQAIEQLKFFQVNNQVSFHTEKALNSLVWKQDMEV